MKLASLKGGRDGRLAVVSNDLSRYVLAEGVANTLQDALDRWISCAPELQKIADAMGRTVQARRSTRTAVRLPCPAPTSGRTAPPT